MNGLVAPGVFDAVRGYLAAREEEFGGIAAERRVDLDRLAGFVRRSGAAGGRVAMTFICTHNSRRSHIAQLWAAAGAAVNGFEIDSYSGGTEATAFHPNAVAAMRRAGFVIDATTGGVNPIYHARFGAGERGVVTCFSKPYGDPPNPKAGFAAVMVCSDADGACPVVDGAAYRLALPYEDPKVSDGTGGEAVMYDERCAQIAREMLYVFSRAASDAPLE